MLGLVSFADAQTSYPVGSTPSAVALGDLNGDNQPDIVVANFDSGNIAVLLNNGDGTFAPSQFFAIGPNPRCVALGDFNSDSHLDVIISVGNGELQLMLSTGTG